LFNENFVTLANAPALLKVGAFFLAWTALWLPLAIPLAIALKWHPPKPITPSQKLPLLTSLYLIAPLVVWNTATTQEQSFSDYGLPWNFSIFLSLSKGLVGGSLGLVAVFAIQRGLGWIKLLTTRKNWLGIVLSTLLLGLWVGFTEELIFRGFLVNQLQEEYGFWTTAAIASLIFALLHLVWEGQENIPQLPGLWLMGMVLALARWVDEGNLGLPWGLHAGWIWAIATLDTAQAIAYTGQVPEWITGIRGKPLAGIMGILFLLITATVLWKTW
jgi:uncharacterized protein